MKFVIRKQQFDFVGTFSVLSRFANVACLRYRAQPTLMLHVKEPQVNSSSRAIDVVEMATFKQKLFYSICIGKNYFVERMEENQCI